MLRAGEEMCPVGIEERRQVSWPSVVLTDTYERAKTED